MKAAWRVLRTDGPNPDIVERYFRRMMKMSLPDGTYETRLVGLVGFHIHRVTPNGHLPSTFEHVDNVELFQVPDDPLPLPKTPSLNPGRRHAHGWSRGPARYPNGYEVEGLSGQPGIIPKAFAVGATVPPVDQRRRINVSRATPIPQAVQRINRRYQAMLRDTVWRYYQLVGTQNKSGTRNNPYVDGENPYLGPGRSQPRPGARRAGTPVLQHDQPRQHDARVVHAARLQLRGCHINAFPHGVEAFPPFEARFTPLHVMSFLLLNALPAQSCDGSRHCSTQHPAAAPIGLADGFSRLAATSGRRRPAPGGSGAATSRSAVTRSPAFRPRSGDRNPQHGFNRRGARALTAEGRRRRIIPACRPAAGGRAANYGGESP